MKTIDDYIKFFQDIPDELWLFGEFGYYENHCAFGHLSLVSHEDYCIHEASAALGTMVGKLLPGICSDEPGIRIHKCCQLIAGINDGVYNLMEMQKHGDLKSFSRYLEKDDINYHPKKNVLAFLGWVKEQLEEKEIEKILDAVPHQNLIEESVEAVEASAV